MSRYQDALMDLLGGEDLGREERLRVLREDPAFAPYASYVEGFDPVLVDFMSALMRKWRRPRPPGSPG